MLARELSQLMARAERIDKKDVYREKLYMVQALEDKISVLSLSKRELFLKPAELRMRSMLPYMYGLVTFEPLHTLHLD